MACRGERSLVGDSSGDDGQVHLNVQYLLRPDRQQVVSQHNEVCGLLRKNPGEAIPRNQTNKSAVSLTPSSCRRTMMAGPENAVLHIVCDPLILEPRRPWSSLTPRWANIT